MGLDYTRELKWFEKVGDQYLVDMENITYLPVKKLEDMLGIGDDCDPNLYGCYDVPEEHIHKLQSYIKHPIDTEKYDYQIGCHSKD
jgi:hypothetical protein